jgi:hypothetical protein
VNLLTLTINDKRLNDELKRVQYIVFEKLQFAFIPLVLILIVTAAVAGEFITQSLQISEVLLRHRCSLLTLVWSVGEFVDLWRDAVVATLRAPDYSVQR